MHGRENNDNENDNDDDTCVNSLYMNFAITLTSYPPTIFQFNNNYNNDPTLLFLNF